MKRAPYYFGIALLLFAGGNTFADDLKRAAEDVGLGVGGLAATFWSAKQLPSTYVKKGSQFSLSIQNSIAKQVTSGRDGALLQGGRVVAHLPAGASEAEVRDLMTRFRGAEKAHVFAKPGVSKRAVGTLWLTGLAASLYGTSDLIGQTVLSPAVSDQKNKQAVIQSIQSQIEKPNASSAN